MGVLVLRANTVIADETKEYEEGFHPFTDNADLLPRTSRITDYDFSSHINPQRPLPARSRQD